MELLNFYQRRNLLSTFNIFKHNWCNKMCWPRNYFDHNAPMVLWRVNTCIYTSTCKCVPTLDVSNLFPIYSIALILKVVLLVRNTLHSCTPLHTVFLPFVLTKVEQIHVPLVNEIPMALHYWTSVAI